MALLEPVGEAPPDTAVGARLGHALRWLDARAAALTDEEPGAGGAGVGVERRRDVMAWLCRVVLRGMVLDGQARVSAALVCARSVLAAAAAMKCSRLVEGVLGEVLREAARTVARPVSHFSAC